MITLSNALAMLLAASVQSPAAQPAAQVAQPATQPAGDQALAQRALASGETRKAIESLEDSLRANPEDPALLINLGIAQARMGEEEAARALFERALASSDPIELETAGGDQVDSRRLARKAIRMLDAGEFAPQLTRRD